MALETRQRLYVDAPLNTGKTVALDRDQSHYLINVLRMTAGSEVLLFNGRDGEWCAIIGDDNKKAALLNVRDLTRPQDGASQLQLVFAPIKKARIDFIAEKAAELGVGILQPVMTDYTQVSRVNTSRLRANAVEAAEQTGRTTLMEIREPIPLTKLLEQWPENRHIIFCDEDCAGDPRHAMAEKIKSISGLGEDAAIFIGPEGGFSPRERDMISEHQAAIPVAFGRNILRADTAMLAALAIWQATVGEWKGRH
jgi:16S rRNA (uracil1498-N3)-methyltransferase